MFPVFWPHQWWWKERGHPSLLRPAVCRLLKHDHWARSLLTESFTLTLQFTTFTPTSLNSMAIYDFFQAPFLGFSLREPTAPSWKFNSTSTGRIYIISTTAPIQEALELDSDGCFSICWTLQSRHNLAWSVWAKRSQMGCLDVARARGAGEEPYGKGMNIQLFWCEWHGISRHLVTWLGPELSVIPQDIPIVLWTVMIQHEILGLLLPTFLVVYMFVLFSSR